MRRANYGRMLFSPAVLARPQHGAVPALPRICRFAVLSFLLATTLGGCAAADKVKSWFDMSPNPQPVATAPIAPAAPPQPARSRRPVRETHDPKVSEKVAAIDPDSLIGLTPSAVEKLLGGPVRIGKSDVSLVWTYASPGCTFQVFFYPDIKTSSFHALKYGGLDGNGGEIESSQACIRNILTARNSGPS
jgi:hypothetical protein